MRLIVFDMDGTLIDTHGLIVENMEATFDQAGMPRPAAADIRRIIGLSVPVAMGELTRSKDMTLLERLADSYRALYRGSLERAHGREALYPGAIEALDRLSRPETSLGIATGKGLNGVHRVLALHGIANRFATLQTPDHNPSKPHPGMLLRAMDETGAKPAETVMIGDTSFDMELAANAGVKAIGVAWGYHQREDLLASGAHTVIERYDDLDAVIDELLG